MDCTRVRDLLPDYSVEILDARAQQAVKAHLDGCEACREELRIQDAVVSLVEEYGVRQPPAGLFNGVRNRIESGELVRERRPWWGWLTTGPARMSAMGLAVASLAVELFLPAGPSSHPEGSRDWLPVFPGAGSTTSALAVSVRQHAMSAADGPLADRVAWEAVAQLASQEREGEKGKAPKLQ